MWHVCLQPAGLNMSSLLPPFSALLLSDLKERHIKIKTRWPLPLFSSHPICPRSSPPSPHFLLFNHSPDHLLSLSIFKFLIHTPLPSLLLSLSLLLLCDISCIIKGDHCSSWGQHQSAVSDVVHYECVSVWTETYVWMFGGWSSHDLLVWKI